MPTLYEHATDPFQYAASGTPLLLSDGRILNWRFITSSGRQSIRGDFFDSNGVATGQSFQSDFGFELEIVATNNGGVAIVYHNNQAPNAQTNEVYLSIYDSTGAAVVEELQVNTTSQSQQYFADVAVLESGRIVVTWQDDSGQNGDLNRGVMARLFDANGTPLGDEFLVNSTTAGIQGDPVIITQLDGGFIISWSGTGGSQLFDADGNRVGPENHAPIPILHVLDNGNILAIEGGANLTIFASDGTTVLATGTAPHFSTFAGSFAGGFVLSVDSSSGPDGTAIFDYMAVQQGTVFSQPMTVVTPDSGGGFVYYAGNTIGHVRADDGIDSIEVTAVPDGLSETTPQNNLIATIALASDPLNTTYSVEILSDSLGGGFALVGNQLFLVDNANLDFETSATVTVTIGATDINGVQHSDTFTFDVVDEAVEQRITASPALPLHHHDSAVLDSGRLVSFGSDSYGSIISGQLHDADLNLYKTFTVADNLAGVQLDIVTLALPGGGFVLTWYSTAGDGHGEGVLARIFDSEANAVSGIITVNTPTPTISRNQDIVALDGGNFLIAWDGADGAGLNQGGIRAQQFTAAGVKVGAEFFVNTALVANQGQVSLHQLSGGGFIATWTDSSGQGGDAAGTGIRGQVFDGAGAKVGGEFLVNTTTAGDQHRSTATTLASGQVLVTWADGAQFDALADGTIRGQLFDSNGAKVGGEIAVQGYAGGLGQHEIVATASGGFALAWTDRESLPDPSGTALWARLFNADGSPAGSRFLVNTDVAGDQRLSELAILPGGELYVGWQSPTTSLARIFDLTGTQTVWPIDDTLNGTVGPDVLRGGTGNDRYIVNHVGDVVIEFAGEGTDIIYSSISYSLNDTWEVESLSTITWELTTPLNLTGNSLANHLIGNAGRNQLDGKAGADTMIGREGNDIYFVDSAGDRPIEIAGQGIDVVYTSISYTLAANTDVEGLATIDFQATNALNLTGNGIVNQLIGNGGANQLDGKSGADSMTGHAGNDKYLVDNAGDRAFEAAGGGTDVVYTGVSFVLTDAQEIEGLSTITWELTNAINLTGNSLKNNLIGNAGANVLDGKAGNDTLQGREGADSYAFTSVLGANNIDAIFGFSSADDTILLENNGVFVGLGAGALNPNAFVIGIAAQDSDDRIIYNQATGQLFFDADGNGAGAQIQFARLDGAPVIGAGDFTVI